jgi:hypothetical protein
MWPTNDGVLQFADRPQDAPIIHFGGPLTLTTMQRQTIRRGKSGYVRMGLGTPGLGAGTFAFTHYDKLVPKGAHPVFDLVFPAPPGHAPMRVHYALERRC